MPRAYYNEHDPFAAAWLRQLIAGGHIAPGDVDERSIEDVLPSDISGYTQCHFFAGIGVWSHALRAAGWADDRPVWTGSCPCQPFSAAGKGAGVADERHLWPAFHHLIAQCRPGVVFGEQVASRDGLAWLDLVHADMEGTGYAFGAVDLCAAGFGAPHIRQRLFFVADADRSGFGARRKGFAAMGHWKTAESDRGPGSLGNAGNERLALGLGKSRISRCESGTVSRETAVGTGVHAGRMVDAEQHGSRCQAESADHGKSEAIGPADQRGGRSGASDGLDNSVSIGRGTRRDDDSEHDGKQTDATRNTGRPGPTNGHWRVADWLYCRDGKWRPVGPGTFPLVDGAPARVGRLRGYGNAIVAPVAEAFIRAYVGAMT